MEEPPHFHPGGRYDQETAIMKKWISYGMPKQRGKTGWHELESKEREKTGIKNLRIKFNKVFGYYLEVTNSYKDLVPEYYIKKADSDQCGALYHTGIERTGGNDSRMQKIS